jgi:TP901 family phage tail tape measure protein
MPGSGRDVGYYALPIIPSFEGGVGKINRDLDKVFGGISKSASKALSEGLGDGVKEAEAKVKASSDKIESLLNKQADATGKLRVATERLNEVRDKGTGTQVARAEEARAKALREQATMTKSLTSETNALERAQKQLADAQERANRTPSTSRRDRLTSGASDLLNGIGSESAIVGRFDGLGKAGGKAFAVGAAAALAAGGLFAAGAKAADLLYDGFKSVVETGIDFERTLNNFQGVTRSTPEQMAKMSAAARALGSDVTLAGASSSSAALAMTELAKAGFSVDESIKAARGTLELATAGQLDAAQAAEIQANAMNAFGLRADSAAHTADLLANAAIASSADVDEIGQSLQQVGGVAHGFGENLDDTVAALAMFANAGIKGSDAGTLLKTTMQSITDQGNPAQGAIQQLGLELYKLNDQGGKDFVGFREMFRQLDEAKKRLNDPEQFQALTNVLFGSDAMRAAMLGTVEDFDTMFDKLQRVGAAAEMADAQMQGLPGAVEAFENTLEGLQLTAFDAIGPALTDGLNSALTWINTHKPELIRFFADIADSALSMGQVFVKSFGLISEGVGQIIGGLGNVFGAILKTGSWIQRKTGDTETADQWLAEAEAMYGWGESLKQAGIAAKNADFDKIRDDIRKNAEQAAEAAKFTMALSGAIALVPDGKTITITDNTPETTENLRKLGIDIVETPNGITVTATTDEAKTILDAFRASQTAEPIAPKVDPDMSPANAKMEQFLGSWRQAVAGLPGPSTGLPSGPTNPLTAPIQPRAAGGMFSSMPTSATIQPAQAGLVQWAEPSTKGEAFIPLGGGKRSVDIWQETGRRLGVWKFDQGGFRGLDALVRQAESMVGTAYSMASGDDCSGSIAQLVNAALGLPPKVDRMSTGTAASWIPAKGGVLGPGPAGTFRIGWVNGGPGGGHMAATLPDGTNVEQGGSTNGFTIGGNAKGADSFPNQAYLPFEVLYPDGTASGGAYSPYGPYGSGSSGGSGGGSYTPATAKQIREADQKVADADARVREVEARRREMEADGKMKESERIRSDNELAKAKRDAQDARTDAAEVKRGKYKEGSSSNGGQSPYGPIGDIAGSFLKETLGLGDLFPDPSELGIVKLLNAALGVKYTPQGDGSFAGGLLAGVANPFPQGFGTDGAASGLPFGMIPNAIDAAGNARPGMAPPGTPASGMGFGAPPGPVDNSRNVSIAVDSGPTSSEIGDVVRREVASVDRLHTYTPIGG